MNWNVRFNGNHPYNKKYSRHTAAARIKFRFPFTYIKSQSYPLWWGKQIAHLLLSVITPLFCWLFFDFIVHAHDAKNEYILHEIKLYRTSSIFALYFSFWLQQIYEWWINQRSPTVCYIFTQFTEENEYKCSCKN